MRWRAGCSGIESNWCLHTECLEVGRSRRTDGEWVCRTVLSTLKVLVVTGSTGGDYLACCRPVLKACPLHNFYFSRINISLKVLSPLMKWLLGEKKMHSNILESHNKNAQKGLCCLRKIYYLLGRCPLQWDHQGRMQRCRPRWAPGLLSMTRCSTTRFSSHQKHHHQPPNMSLVFLIQVSVSKRWEKVARCLLTYILWINNNTL